MIDWLAIRPDDRILLLSIPHIALIRELSARLTAGLVVGLGEGDEVYEARRQVADRVNVMFHPGPPEEIPFRDAFFSKVIDLRCRWRDPARAALETARVLAPGGQAYLAISDAGPLIEAGLEEGDAVAGLRVVRRR